MEFYYKGYMYGVVRNNGFIAFYQGNSSSLIQYYQTDEEFIAKANIDGILLKDIWHEVEEPDYM